MPDLKISELDLTTDPDGLLVPGARAGANFKFDIGPIQDSIDDHIADTSGAHAGTAISNTPAGDISATTVQAAINELDTEKASVTYVDGKITDAIVDGDVGRAPTQNAVFDALALKQPVDTDGTFIGTIFTSSQAVSVADNTNYFLGPYSSIAPPTSANQQKFTFPQSGTIKYAIITIRQATQGSGEDIAVNLRESNTTDKLVKSNVQLDDFAANSSIQYLVTGLSISVTAGLDYETKISIPTLTTNGTNQIFTVQYFLYK